MRRPSARATTSAVDLELRDSKSAENASQPAAQRRAAGTEGIFEEKGSRFLYTSYRDVKRQAAQEEHQVWVSDGGGKPLRDRLSKVEQGLPAAEMKKLKYEDTRESLILD